MNPTQGNIIERGVTAAPPISVDPEELLDAGETAKLLRQKPQTLATWRCENRGPEYVKIGRSVFYRRSAISGWLAQQIVRPGAAARRATSRDIAVSAGPVVRKKGAERAVARGR